jgi:hypothetical protein
MSCTCRARSEIALPVSGINVRVPKAGLIMRNLIDTTRSCNTEAKLVGEVLLETHIIGILNGKQDMKTFRVCLSLQLLNFSLDLDDTSFLQSNCSMLMTLLNSYNFVCSLGIRNVCVCVYIYIYIYIYIIKTLVKNISGGNFRR